MYTSVKRSFVPFIVVRIYSLIADLQLSNTTPRNGKKYKRQNINALTDETRQAM